LRRRRRRRRRRKNIPCAFEKNILVLD